MRKVYVVSEFGGEYDYKWDHIVAVCNDKIEAERLKRQIEDEHNDNGVIDNRLYDKLLIEMYNYYEDKGGEYDYETEIEDLHKLFPEYSIKDLEKANARYYDWQDWHGVSIEEVDFYE